MKLEIGIGLLIAALITCAIYDEVSWRRYAAAHHCEQTGQTYENTITEYTFDDKGNITGSYPIYVTYHLYACDDNTQHWR